MKVSLRDKEPHSSSPRHSDPSRQMKRLKETQNTSWTLINCRRHKEKEINFAV